MEKKFTTAISCDMVWYATEDEAITASKRSTAKYMRPYYVLQATQKVETAPPEAIVTKL